MFSLLLLPIKVQSQVSGKDLWILYDKNDSLCHKGANGTSWDFFRTSYYENAFCFRIKEKPVRPDTIKHLPVNIKLTHRNELFNIKSNLVTYTNKEKSAISLDFDWLNKLYRKIYIVEPINNYYLIYHVKFHACEI